MSRNPNSTALTRAGRLAAGAVRGTLRPVAAAERGARAAAGRLAGNTALAMVDAIIASPYTERALDRMLDSPLAERAVGRAVSGPLVEAVAHDVADHAVVERVTDELLRAGVADRLLDQFVERLLESEELWVLVDEIAQSPAVSEAITQQSLGFADEIADEVNHRTRRADAIAERVARRLVRRRARVQPPPADSVDVP
jgi:hypothetical protein